MNPPSFLVGNRVFRPYPAGCIPGDLWEIEPSFRGGWMALFSVNYHCADHGATQTSLGSGHQVTLLEATRGRLSTANDKSWPRQGCKQVGQHKWLSPQSWRLGTARKQSRVLSYRAGRAVTLGSGGFRFTATSQLQWCQPLGPCHEHRGKHWCLPGPRVQDKAWEECGVPFS